MPTYNPEVEMAALQFVLQVLIEAHPDRANLLAVFDRLHAQYQPGMMPPGWQGMSAAMSEAIVKYRAWIATTS